MNNNEYDNIYGGVNIPGASFKGKYYKPTKKYVIEHWLMIILIIVAIIAIIWFWIWYANREESYTWMPPSGGLSNKIDTTKFMDGSNKEANIMHNNLINKRIIGQKHSSSKPSRVSEIKRNNANY